MLTVSVVHVDEKVKRKWQSSLWIRACLLQKRNQSRKNSVTCLLIQTSDPEAVIMEKGRDWGSPTPIPAMVNMSGIFPFSTRYEMFLSSPSEATPLASEGFCCCHAPSLSIPLFRLHCTHLDLYIVRLQLLASTLLWFSNWDKLPKNNKSLIVLLHPSEKLKINFNLLRLTQKVRQHVIIKILSARVSTAGDSCLSPLSQYPIYGFFLSSDTQFRIPTTIGWK